MGSGDFSLEPISCAPVVLQNCTDDIYDEVKALITSRKFLLRPVGIFIHPPSERRILGVVATLSGFLD